MVAEAAAQSVAMVEEASMTSRHKDHTVDRYRRIIASVQAEVRRLTAQVREQEEAKVKLEKVRAGCTQSGVATLWRVVLTTLIMMQALADAKHHASEASKKVEHMRAQSELNRRVAMQLMDKQGLVDSGGVTAFERVLEQGGSVSAGGRSVGGLTPRHGTPLTPTSVRSSASGTKSSRGESALSALLRHSRSTKGSGGGGGGGGGGGAALGDDGGDVSSVQSVEDVTAQVDGSSRAKASRWAHAPNSNADPRLLHSPMTAPKDR